MSLKIPKTRGGDIDDNFNEDESDIDNSDNESVVDDDYEEDSPKLKKYRMNGDDDDDELGDDDDDDEDESEEDDLEENEDEDDDLQTGGAEDLEIDDDDVEGIEKKQKKGKSKKPIIQQEIDFDDNDLEPAQEDQYYQKLKNHIKRSTILEHHPEIQFQNYEEVETLSNVVRNQNGQIIDPFHTTVPFLTKYEKADILGKRASQINEGAALFTQVDPSVIDGYLIALKEFEEKKIPFIIQRPLPNGSMEYWKLQDLEII